MSKCSACEDLRNDAPNFVLNGVTSEACTSLQNNTGFNPSLVPLNDNCTDLDNANECLIGNMADQVEAYDVCEWKDYMRKFVPNVYTVIKGMICGECGIWTNIKNLWTKVDCIADNFDVISTPRMWVEKSNIQYQNGFVINENSTGVAVSYCNTHCYTLFTLTDAMKRTLQAEEVYTNPVLVFSATGTWDAPFNIIRQEEQIGVTSGGFFTFMASHHNNGDGTHTVKVFLRSRLRSLDSFSADGIIVNMPTNIKLLGSGTC